VPAGASGQLREALVSGHGFTLFLSPFFGFALFVLCSLWEFEHAHGIGH